MVQQIQPRTGEHDVNESAQEAAATRPPTPEEAESLARTELNRLLDLLTSFEVADWEKPTHCTRWNVRQVVAHLAGATAIHADRAVLLQRAAAWNQDRADEPGQSMAGYMSDLAGISPEQRRSYREAGFNPLETLTQFEVDERTDASPTELVAELRATGRSAFVNRRTMSGRRCRSRRRGNNSRLKERTARPGGGRFVTRTRTTTQYDSSGGS